MALLNPEATAVGNKGPQQEGKAADSSAAQTPDARSTRKYRRNFFVATPNTSGAETGRTEGDRGGEEGEQNSEWVSFRTSTLSELGTFDGNLAANYAQELGKPGGESLLAGDPAMKDLFDHVFEGKRGAGYDSEEVQRNIDRMHESPQGIMRSLVGLEEATADGLFVLGLASTAELAKKDIDPMTILDDFKPNDDAEVGAARRLGRRVRRRIGRTAAAKWVKEHPKTSGTAAGAAAGQLVGQVAESGAIHHEVAEAVKFLYHHIPDIPHTPAALTTYAGSAAGLAIGWYLERRAENQDKSAYEASKAALEAIKADPDHAARIKALWKIDVNDFRFNDDTGSIEVVDQPKSRAKLSTVLEGVTSNLETRKHVLEDLGVPEADMDLMPELFILRNEPTQYERTGLRIHQDIMDKYDQLSGEQVSAPDVDDPPADEKMRALVVDLDGRDHRDPLWGRGYPEDVRIPRYDVDNLLGEKLDRWEQARLDPDPTRQSALRTHESDFYGRTNEASIYLLDSPDIRFVDRTDVVRDGDDEKIFQNGELAERSFLDRFRRSSRPEAVIRRKMLKDSTGHDTAELDKKPDDRIAGTFVGMYEYEVRNGKEVNVPLDRIFYVDKYGERQPLASLRTFKESDGTFEYTGIDEATVMKNSFYIPTDGTPPLPLSMIEHLAKRNPENGTVTDVDKYVCREGKTAKVEVTERVFTGVNKEGRAEPLPQIYYEDDNLEGFYRDNALQTPLGEDASFYGRVREKYLIANLQKLFPPGTKIGGVEGRASLEEIIDAVQKGRVALQGELRIEDIVDYFRGDEIPPRAKELLDDTFPSKDVILGPLLPRGKEAFKAQDSAGRSPADIRFGITDQDILDALDDLPEAALSHFDSDTGLDEWDQGPGDPFFCRANREHFEVTLGRLSFGRFVNLNDEIDLDSIVVDQWGQEKMKDGKPNPFFMRQEEGEQPQGQLDLRRYRLAREFVLQNLTEDIIERNRKFPERTVSVIQTKIDERGGEGEEAGRVRKDRTEKLTEAKDNLTDLKKEFGDRIAYVDRYDEAREQRDTLQRELREIIYSSFDGTQADRDDPAKLKKKISEFQQGIGGLVITVDGVQTPLKSLSARRQEEITAYDAYKTEIDSWEREDQFVQNPNGTVGQMKESTETLRRRKTQAKREAAVEHQAKLEEIERRFREDATRVATIATEIDLKFEPLEEQEKLIAPKADYTADRHKVLYSRIQSRTDAWNMLQSPGMSALLRRGDLEAILEEVHRLNGAEPFAWAEIDDEDESKREVVQYAMLLAKASEDTEGMDIVRGFIEHPVLPIIESYGITYEMLEELPIDELNSRLVGKSLDNGTGGNINEAIVAEARETVIDYAYRMKRTTRDLNEEFGVKIGRIDRLVKDIDFEDELDQLEVTKDIMKRQGDIFNATALYMSGVDTVLPIKGDKSRLFSDLSDREKDPDNGEYTASEIAVGPDTPLGYYDVMNLFFAYQGRSDKNEYFGKIHKLLPPETLHEIMRDAAENAWMPIPMEPGGNLGEFFFSLQDQIIKGLVTRRALRQMFVGVIDHLEARAMALE